MIMKKRNTRCNFHVHHTFNNSSISFSAIVILLIFVIGALVILYHSDNSAYLFGCKYTVQEFSLDKCASVGLETFVAQIKQCVLEYIHNAVSHRWLIPAVSCCSKKFASHLNFTKLKNKDETKYIILPHDTATNVKCTVVTIGIGNDIIAENGLKSFLPSCKFYGADPIKDSGKLYEIIGKYYNVAVGAEGGRFDASVLIGENYEKAIVSYVSLKEFFNMAGIIFVDYMFLDAEGAEYNLLHLLESADSLNFTVCQINIEFHLPLKNYGTTAESFNNKFKSFIESSNFIPIAAVDSGHIRTMWLNIGNENCVLKYLPRACRM